VTISISRKPLLHGFIYLLIYLVNQSVSALPHLLL